MLGFIIAVAAGFLTPHIETPIAKPLAEAIRPAVALEPGELRLLSFMVAMILAAVLSAVFSTGSALGLMIGGALGYFALRLTEAAKSASGGRK